MNVFTSWDDVPLVLGIEDAARVLNTSVRTIRRRLRTGQFVPGVMPRLGGQTAPHRFSKQLLQQYVEGGYAKFTVVKRRA